ncbi:MAG: heme o synthase [Myxococcota bacterium]|nr:heme o synthase [Myxococcota bacterium]
MSTAQPTVFKDLIALTKPSLSTLVVITAAGGWFLAPNDSGWEVGFFAVLGTTITVGAANTFNQYLERDSDQLMARTKTRPLARQRLNPQLALWFGIVLTLIAIPMITLLANPLCGLLAGIALIFYVLIYTPMKRTSSFNTIVGAIPGAMPPLIGWTAATNAIDAGGLLLFALLFIWQIPHSLAITIYRQEEYNNAGIIVFPSVQGLNATRFQMLMYTMSIAALPPLLFLTQVTGWGTLIVGTGLGLWWLYAAWDGYSNEKGAKWARKFFFGSLIYLSGLFAVMSIDVLIKYLL